MGKYSKPTSYKSVPLCTCCTKLGIVFPIHSKFTIHSNSSSHFLANVLLYLLIKILKEVGFCYDECNYSHFLYLPMHHFDSNFSFLNCLIYLLFCDELTRTGVVKMGYAHLKFTYMHNRSKERESWERTDGRTVRCATGFRNLNCYLPPVQNLVSMPKCRIKCKTSYKVDKHSHDKTYIYVYGHLTIMRWTIKTEKIQMS